MTEENRDTLGRALFGEHLPYGIKISAVEERRFHELLDANNVEEVKDRLFVLKLDSGNIIAKCKTLEHLFGCLIDENQSHIYNDTTSEKLTQAEARFVKQCRERIGSMALDVFFEAVFERDKEACWQWMTETTTHRSDLAVRPPGSQAEEIARQDLKNYISQGVLPPDRLLMFLKYLAYANKETKTGHVSRIRKFLKEVLDKPILLSVEMGTRTVASEAVGISRWAESARHTLACALVANGMYEECLDYNLSEAYKPLLYKLLGGFQETDDGFVQQPRETGRDGFMPLTWDEALQKACEDKEWGHILGVIIRIGLKHSHIRAQTPFAFMENFAQLLSEQKLTENKLVLSFLNPPVLAEKS